MISIGIRLRACAACLLGILAGHNSFSVDQNLQSSDANPVSLPAIGSYQLRIITPQLLELSTITTKKPDPARVTQWDFVDSTQKTHLPAKTEFAVFVDEKSIPVQAIGFKRRVLFAPLKRRDLRIANYLYLQLQKPIAGQQTVVVQNPSGKLWPASNSFSVKSDPFRWSPVIHVNQTGYLPEGPKLAMAGYYLGSLGELDVEKSSGTNGFPTFKILDARSRQEAYQGTLTARPDRGFPFESYQHVLQANFSEFQRPGEYILMIPGYGVSYPFRIEEGVAACFARTYALGIYHQRCGQANALPFTRFTHDPCHRAPAEVPSNPHKFEAVNQVLEKETANYKDNPRHTAPPLKNISASLYPFIKTGTVDVSGGHHDAGDYSKYTINSAAFIHQLVFAADVFPGVVELDNLGLPESGDGKSDILQEAKWEADFLAKMQDSDGGFYFLVYPKEREYEIDALPDHGDPQVVFPKTTAATAAATAALAQCASSPNFKKQFPEAATHYLKCARKGWEFLERAIAKFGKDGAYQKITHYGDYFQHDDELAWAACELFLATGEAVYQERLIDGFDPTDPNTRMWSWWRLFDAYGSAIRSYAFAVKSGRLNSSQIQPLFLERCQAEIAAAGDDQLKRAEDSAYGTSFPQETKRTRTAGWYFSGDAAFDLAVASQLDFPIKNDPRPQYLRAIWSNLNYEQGCNPVNITYLTGLGSKRQREIVHQYAQNDRRVLPPSGIPLGNIQAGFGWMDTYKQELGALSFPPDSAEDAPYPIYDRWGDSFNLTQEFVIVNQARSLGYLAWLMAQTPMKKQPFKSNEAQIIGLPATVPGATKLVLSLTAKGADLQSARVVWEAEGQEPVLSQTFEYSPSPIKSGTHWVEAEAQLPDGRRVFAATNFPAGR
jgi:hypothetical protein